MLLIFNYFNFYIIFEHSMNNNNKQKKILGYLSLFFLFLHCFFLSFLSLAPCFLCVILFLFLNSLSLFFVLQAFDETIENDATQQFVCKRLNSFFFLKKKLIKNKANHFIIEKQLILFYLFC